MKLLSPPTSSKTHYPHHHHFYQTISQTQQTNPQPTYLSPPYPTQRNALNPNPYPPLTSSLTPILSENSRGKPSRRSIPARPVRAAGSRAAVRAQTRRRPVRCRGARARARYASSGGGGDGPHVTRAMGAGRRPAGS